MIRIFRYIRRSCFVFSPKALKIASRNVSDREISAFVRLLKSFEIKRASLIWIEVFLRNRILTMQNQWKSFFINFHFTMSLENCFVEVAIINQTANGATWSQLSMHVMLVCNYFNCSLIVVDSQTHFNSCSTAQSQIHDISPWTASMCNPNRHHQQNQ